MTIHWGRFGRIGGMGCALCLVFVVGCGSESGTKYPVDIAADQRAEVGTLDVVGTDGQPGEDGTGNPDGLDEETRNSDLLDTDLLADADGGDGREDADTEDETGDLVGEEVVPGFPVDIAHMIQHWPLGTVTDWTDGALLAETETPFGPIGVLVLSGTNHQMGYQHGFLVADRLAVFFQQFLEYYLEDFDNLAASLGLPPGDGLGLLQTILLTIWDHLEPFVTQEYLDEFEGFGAGMAAAGVTIAGWDPVLAGKALLVLSNISDLDWGGGMEKLMQKLDTGMSESLRGHFSSLESALRKDERAVWALIAGASRRAVSRPSRLQHSCSFFGAWGDHTVDGHYIGSRNLDWATDTGIVNMRGLVFYFPTGGIPHVAVGYLGFIGSLAGMSKAGVVLSEVGSVSSMERLKGEPWGLKFRRILANSPDLDAALAIALGSDALAGTHPPTIGYNFGVGYGDPLNAGLDAGGAVLETNGLRIGMYRHAANCDVTATLYQYDQAGHQVSVTSHEDNPALVNQEADAVEVGPDGLPKRFKVYGDGAFVWSDGNPVPDENGAPLPVGRATPCAFYRGDEALMHGMRMQQKAANGPQGPNGLLIQAGSYRNRYTWTAQAIAAIREGLAYDVHVPDNQGNPRTIGLTEGEWIARGAAMGSNVLSVVYDATALTMRISWENGEGPTWINAQGHEYVFIDAGAIFELGMGE